MAITVYKIGVHYKYFRNFPIEVVEQLTFCSQLWRDLVTVHERWERQKLDLWSSYPEIAAIEDEIAEQEQVFSPTAVPTETQKKDAAAAIKVLREERRKAINAVVEENRPPQLDEINTERDAAIKALYHVYREKGLFWATINDVIRRRFNHAVKKVAERRKQGLPARLRNKPFNGTGVLRVQVQRGAEHPARTPERLSDPDGRWSRVLLLPPPVAGWEQMGTAQRRLAARQVIRMRMGWDPDGYDQWVDIPVIMHRMLDPQADITEAFFTVRRYGAQLRGWVTLTARIPDPQPVVRGPMVAFHLGWRAEPDGSTRTATWRSTEPLVIPERARHIMRADGSGKSGVVVMPTRLLERFERLTEHLAERDQALNDLRDKLIAWVERTGTPLPNPYPDQEDQPLTSARLRKWLKPSRFVVLSRHLKKLEEWQDSEPARELHAWVRHDQKAWSRTENARSAIHGARNWSWAEVGAIISSQAGELVVDDMNLAEIARKSGDTDLPPVLAQAAARRRHLAAPGELRAAVVKACQRDGVTVTTIPSKNLSREHTCGYVSKKAFTMGETCPQCNRQVDVDAMTTLTMIKRAVNG